MCSRIFKLPDNPNLPNIGVTSPPNVTLASNGQGGGSGMGTGYGGGLGSGTGNGFGPGTGGNAGGGLYPDGRRSFSAGADLPAWKRSSATKRGGRSTRASA